MKKILGIENQDEFETCFPNEEACLEFLATAKWDKEYHCRKCGNTNYCKGKTPHSRRCTRCKHEESATSHTIFHNCRIPLTKAFKMSLLVCNDPAISTYKLSDEFETRQMTCWKFKKKILECIENGASLIKEESKTES